MKYLAAGFAILIVAGLDLVFLTTFPNTPIPPQNVALANVFLMLVGLGVLFSGGGEVRRGAQVLRDEDSARAKLATLQPRLDAVVEEKFQLERKVTALEEKLKAAGEKTTARPEAIDAELVGLLSLLQRRGRFVDFLMDDVTKYDDAQVGAAARVVHQGCADVVKEFFEIEPIRKDTEGDLVTLASDYLPERYQLVGKVAGTPPFRGTLLHRGWRTTRVTLPRIAASGQHDVIAPAEVELN